MNKENETNEKTLKKEEDKFFKVINSDRYQYTESSIYLKNNMENQTATFDLFIRTEIENDFGIVSGIEEVIELIDILNKTPKKDRKNYLEKIYSFYNKKRYIKEISS